jgi:hypothetical protein
MIGFILLHLLRLVQFIALEIIKHLCQLLFNIFRYILIMIFNCFIQLIKLMFKKIRSKKNKKKCLCQHIKLVDIMTDDEH